VVVLSLTMAALSRIVKDPWLQVQAVTLTVQRMTLSQDEVPPERGHPVQP